MTCFRCSTRVDLSAVAMILAILALNQIEAAAWDTVPPIKKKKSLGAGAPDKSAVPPTPQVNPEIIEWLNSGWKTDVWTSIQNAEGTLKVTPKPPQKDVLDYLQKSTN